MEFFSCEKELLFWQKNFRVDVSLCSKYASGCFMMLESDAKFEEKVARGLENDMKNMANFHQSTQKS